MSQQKKVRKQRQIHLLKLREEKDPILGQSSDMSPEFRTCRVGNTVVYLLQMIYKALQWEINFTGQCLQGK